jgi:hypothetical protein
MVSSNQSAPAVTEAVVESTLSAQVLPNPSTVAFTIITKSDKSDALTVRVLNGVGAVIEVRNGLPANGRIIFGGNYRPGVFYAEVLQGSRKVSLKLIKQ